MMRSQERLLFPEVSLQSKVQTALLPDQEHMARLHYQQHLNLVSCLNAVLSEKVLSLSRQYNGQVASAYQQAAASLQAW